MVTPHGGSGQAGFFPARIATGLSNALRDARLRAEEVELGTGCKTADHSIWSSAHAWLVTSAPGDCVTPTAQQTLHFTHFVLINDQTRLREPT